MGLMDQVGQAVGGMMGGQSWIKIRSLQAVAGLLGKDSGSRGTGWPRPSISEEWTR